MPVAHYRRLQSVRIHNYVYVLNSFVLLTVQYIEQKFYRASTDFLKVLRNGQNVSFGVGFYVYAVEAGKH